MIGGMSKTCRAGAVHLGGVGEVGSAATATGGFVADHDVRVGHLLQGLPTVSLLPAGLPLRGPPQRSRCGRVGTVGGGRLGRVLRIRPQLCLQISYPHFQCRVLRPQGIELDAHSNDQLHQFGVGRLRHSSIIAFPLPLFGNTPNTTFHSRRANLCVHSVLHFNDRHGRRRAGRADQLRMIKPGEEVAIPSNRGDSV